MFMCVCVHVCVCGIKCTSPIVHLGIEWFILRALWKNLYYTSYHMNAYERVCVCDTHIRVWWILFIKSTILKLANERIRVVQVSSCHWFWKLVLLGSHFVLIIQQGTDTIVCAMIWSKVIYKWNFIPKTFKLDFSEFFFFFGFLMSLLIFVTFSLLCDFIIKRHQCNEYCCSEEQKGDYNSIKAALFNLQYGIFRTNVNYFWNHAELLV